MNLLLNLGITEQEIMSMLEQYSFLKELSHKEIMDKIAILKYVNCQDRHIKNIIVSNPSFLDRLDTDIIKLIQKLFSLKITNLNLLFDTNPYLLNKDDYEIDNYIKEQLKEGKLLENIIDEFESNPYIIDEI